MSDDKPAITAIESTFDDLTAWGEAKPMTLADISAAIERQLTAPPPAWKPRMILVSPQEAAALAQWRAAEIDTSVVYEPQQYPSVVGRWTVTREQAMPAPWCLTFQRAVSEDEMRQHVADYYRTRITPGADPRAQWAKGDAPSDTRMFLGHDDAGYSARLRAQVRKLPRGPRRGASRRDTARWSMFEMAGVRGAAWTVIEYGASLPGCNYVPCDVFRWRDLQHRAELTRRAREYAECAQTLVDR